MIEHFLVEHFRGIDSLAFDCTDRMHIFGPNGSGKTHILDAIHLMTLAKSIYTSAPREENFLIEILFGKNITQQYKYAVNEKKESFLIQGAKLTRAKYLANLPFRTVYISPFDMNILYFAPEMRRNYMDDILARAYEGFSHIKKDYESVMRQRNALLRRIREGEMRIENLDFWDKKFAELAGIYGQYRTKYLEYVNAKIPEYAPFFGDYAIKMEYQGDWIFTENPESTIITYLREHRERDIFSGHTHIGPHRDDFFLSMGDVSERHSVQFFLSRGEMKMLLLGLKLIEADMLASLTEKSLVLLVDDIFSELDDENILRFLNIITTHQMILTSQKPLPDAIDSQKFACINLTSL